MIPVGRRNVRVVVAGIGAVTPMGPTSADLWDGVKNGRVAIGPVSKLQLSDHPVSIGGEVTEEVLPPSGPRGTAPDRAVRMAIRAGQEALAYSGVLRAGIPAARWAVVIASCRPGLSPRWQPPGIDEAPRVALDLMPQATAEALGAAFGFGGPVVAVDSACAGGTIALGYAADLIRFRHADAALVGGTEVVSDLAFAGFNSVEALSSRPAAPYSRDRDGLNLSEGSAMLVLVRDDIALDMLPLAEVLGHGLSADGYHPTAPHPEGEGAARAICAALEAAGVDASMVTYVNGHGTGTPKNDRAETRAIRRALGPGADDVLVSSTKSMVGHLLGAAGAVEAVVTTLALQHQLVPPTANLTNPDPACDLDYVPCRARPAAIDVAISNSFGFGGTNACLVLGRPGRPAFEAPARSVPMVMTGLFTDVGAPGASTFRRLEPDASDFITPKQRRRLDRLSVFAVVAAGRALGDARLHLDRTSGNRVGVVFATALGPHEAASDFMRPVVRDGARAANPAAFPNVVRSAAPGCIATHLNTRGPMLSVVAGHAAGAAAIAYAGDLLRSGKADAMVVVAADTLSDGVLDAYRTLSMDGPQAQGFRLAESLAGVVLEPLNRARARGAQVYGEVLGYGLSSDGLGPRRAGGSGIGIARAMSASLRDAGRQPSDISAVWSAAAGFLPMDRAETAAIGKVVGPAVTVFAPKTDFGEPLAAGGPLLCSLALKSLAGQAGGDQRNQERAAVLVNASSVGGSHVSVVLGRAP